MCSEFLMKRMENYQAAGDLTDIIQTNKLLASSAAEVVVQEWQFPSSEANNIVYSSEYFGDPFADIRDPFLGHDMDMDMDMNMNMINTPLICHQEEMINNTDRQIMKRPTSMFSRMLQIYPADHGKLINPSSSSSSLKAAAGPTDQNSSNSNPAAPPPQISSPRNTGIKRRKSQAKKVVCIPAPAPANSRPTGEIVPSDLWAWRKYGQKPIKGSPYPRGYYRCSSSKGCSARKQVERSRTDPNMLVITYTSEHNHPWPTQRNALAGSTRSNTSKTCTTTTTTSKNNSSPKSANPKEDKKKIPTDHQEEIIIINNINPPLSQVLDIVKEEMDIEDFDNNNNNNLEMEDHAEEFDQAGFPQSYKPTMPPPDSTFKSDQDLSFFVEMDQAEDPLNLLFTQTGRENKSLLDPFSFYDWAGNSSINATSTSYAETKRD